LKQPAIRIDHLPYVAQLEGREPSSVDLVVIHCTELPDLASAREYGERVHYPETGTGNSGHFYIERNGRIEQWVPPERIAHHVRTYNERSIGIELDNKGRYPAWFDSRHQAMGEPYRPPLLNSLVILLQYLCIEFPGLKWISGHEALDRSQVPASDNPELRVYRKQDPGPFFPWKKLLSQVELKQFNP